MNLPDDSPRRPRFSAFIASSVDGYIARTDGSIDWLDAVAREGEDYGFERFFATVDTLVLGRSTYEVALGFESWPYAGKRCIVLTHRPIDSRNGEERFEGGVDVLARKLADEGAARVYVDGGDTIRQFLEVGVLDDLTWSIVPVLLGSGIRLFGPRETGSAISLVDAHAFESGLVQLRYAFGTSAG